MKYYGIVLKNGESKVLASWAEAQAFIKTCPSAANYKSFGSEAEAQGYVDKILGMTSIGHDENAQDDANLEKSMEHGIAYVDGSFNAKTNTWGYGVVLFTSAKPEDVTTQSGSGTAHAEHRNVTGECSAAMRAVVMAMKRGYKKLTIYHDYEGIAAWPTGAWPNANNEMSKSYRAWMQDKQGKIEIRFAKVKGHTGVIYNEMVDALSKKGCGIV